MSISKNKRRTLITARTRAKFLGKTDASTCTAKELKSWFKKTCVAAGIKKVKGKETKCDKHVGFDKHLRNIGRHDEWLEHRQAMLSAHELKILRGLREKLDLKIAKAA